LRVYPGRRGGVAAKFSFDNFTSSGTGITAELLNLSLAYKATWKVYGIKPLQTNGMRLAGQIF